jgi:hypothetical protein
VNTISERCQPEVAGQASVETFHSLTEPCVATKYSATLFSALSSLSYSRFREKYSLVCRFVPSSPWLFENTVCVQPTVRRFRKKAALYQASLVEPTRPKMKCTGSTNSLVHAMRGPTDNRGSLAWWEVLCQHNITTSGYGKSVIHERGSRTNISTNGHFFGSSAFFR